MQSEDGGTDNEGGSTMQADDPLDMIKFGIMHTTQTLIMYCSDPDCVRTWRVGINPMDTLPMLNERALDHVTQVHGGPHVHVPSPMVPNMCAECGRYVPDPGPACTCPPADLEHRAKCPRLRAIESQMDTIITRGMEARDA
jgi:hypothetical protein